MLRSRTILGLVALSCSLVACWHRVSPGNLPGTYVATYPFGTETLTLNQDGSFTQQITIKNEQPLITKGSWVFDPQESRLNLSGLTVAVDGLGHLIHDWRTAEPGTGSLPVDIVWFKITVNSGAPYPYTNR
jgi:hypothetical protein